jgi:TonB family protein
VDATRDDVWGDYIAALNQKIDQHWQRISVATTRQSKVKFIVNRQGDLVSAELVQSSGDATADQTAIQAVQTAAPFAPLPEHATENLLIINFTFTYHVASNAP